MNGIDLQPPFVRAGTRICHFWEMEDPASVCWIQKQHPQFSDGFENSHVPSLPRDSKRHHYRREKLLNTS